MNQPNPARSTFYLDLAQIHQIRAYVESNPGPFTSAELLSVELGIPPALQHDGMKRAIIVALTGCLVIRKIDKVEGHSVKRWHKVTPEIKRLYR